MLNPAGRDCAITAVGRYVRLARAMGVGRLDLLATAAVRDATDGPAFTSEIERRFDIPVRVLSGEDEGRLAALGVLLGTPDADGVVADLGVITSYSIHYTKLYDGRGRSSHWRMPHRGRR